MRPKNSAFLLIGGLGTAMIVLTAVLQQPPAERSASASPQPETERNEAARPAPTVQTLASPASASPEAEALADSDQAGQGTPETAATTPEVQAEAPAGEPEPAPADPPRAHGPYREVHALVIGNNTYPKPLSALESAEPDASSVAETLAAKYGFTVHQLLGKEATAHAIRQKLDLIRTTATPESDIIFYFAGHGISKRISDEKDAPRMGFAIPYVQQGVSDQTDLETLRRTAIDTQSLVSDLRSWRVRHRIVIFDCCFSGLALTNGAVAKLREFDPKLIEQPTMQVITAGREDEIALESGGHGLFTQALLKVLRQEDLQSFLRAFLGVYETVVTSREYLDEPQAGTPQHRLFTRNDGEFYLLPYEAQGDWEKIKAASDYRAQFSTAERAIYGQPATPEEHKQIVERAEKNETVELNPEARARYEARAALGDPISMAILTEYYGKQKDPASQDRARRVANEAYDTGQQHGIFALGRVYRKGYGVEKDEQLADVLEKRSGLGHLLKFIQTLNEVDDAVDALQRGDASKMAALMDRTRGALGAVRNVFGRGPVGRMKRGMNGVQTALSRNDYRRVQRELADWRRAVESLELPFDEKQAVRDSFLKEIDALLDPNQPLGQRRFREGLERLQKMMTTLEQAYDQSSKNQR